MASVKYSVWYIVSYRASLCYTEISNPLKENYLWISLRGVVCFCCCFSFVYLGVCLHACEPSSCSAHESQKGHWIPWNWSCKLVSCHVALETEPRSSAKLQALLTTELPLQPLWKRVQNESQRLWSQATWTWTQALMLLGSVTFGR